MQSTITWCSGSPAKSGCYLAIQKNCDRVLHLIYNADKLQWKTSGHVILWAEMPSVPEDLLPVGKDTIHWYKGDAPAAGWYLVKLVSINIDWRTVPNVTSCFWTGTHWEGKSNYEKVVQWAHLPN